MNPKAWDFAIEAKGIQNLSINAVKHITELEKKGFTIKYLTQKEFEDLEESLPAVMRFTNETLFMECSNLYMPKPEMRRRLEKYFGISGEI